MNLSDLKPGMRVLIVAKDHFFAFVNGWEGQVQGLNNGAVQIETHNPDGQALTLFVPPDQLQPFNFLTLPNGNHP